MSLHIIIDGYNLIRQSDTFRFLDRQSMQRGREALVDVLAAYKKIKSHTITVVFDGAQAPPLAPQSDRVKGIIIEFSRNGESADTVISGWRARKDRKPWWLALIVKWLTQQNPMGPPPSAPKPLKIKSTWPINWMARQLSEMTQRAGSRQRKRKDPAEGFRKESAEIELKSKSYK